MVKDVAISQSKPLAKPPKLFLFPHKGTFIAMTSLSLCNPKTKQSTQTTYIKYIFPENVDSEASILS